MRLLGLIFFFTVLGFSIQAQESLYEVRFEDETLLKALRTLKKESSARLAYSIKDVRNHRVNGEFNQKSLSHILAAILPSELDFQEREDLIVIYSASSLSASGLEPQLKNFNLAGVCKDFHSEEELPHASLRVIHSGMLFQTDGKGSFKLDNFPVDTSLIEVSYVGYKSYFFRPQDFSDKDRILIRLKTDATLINGAIVESYDSPVFVAKREFSEFFLDVNRVNNLNALGEPDALSLAKQLPGFDLTTGNNSGLGTRGMTSSENLYYLDGYPVLNPDHFFGLFSSINTLSVKSIRVLKSGYSPEFGGRNSAVLDMTSYEGSKKHLGLKVQSGLLSSSGRISGPIVKDKASFSISGRKSHVGVLSSPLYEELFNSIYNSSITLAGQTEELDAFDSELTPEIDFLDAQGKIQALITPKLSLELSGFVSQDFSSQEIQDNLENDNFKIGYTNQYEWINIGSSLSLDYELSQRLELENTFSYADFSTRSFSLEEISGDFSTNSFSLQSSFENELSDFTYKNKWNYSYNDSLKIGFGYEMNSLSFLSDETSFGLDVFADSSDQVIHSGFLNINKRLKRFVINAGLRSIYHTGFDRNYLEPRLQFSFEPSQNLFIKGAYGIHHQFLRKVRSLNFFRGFAEEWQLTSPNRFPVSMSRQTSLGVHYRAKSWRVNSEFFSNFQEGTIENLSQLVSRANQNREMLTEGERNTIGLETTLQYNFKQNKISLNYTWADSETKIDDNGEQLGFQYEGLSRNNLSLLWFWENNKFSLAVNGLVAQGRAYTPVEGSYVLELLNGSYRPFLVLGEINSQELPTFVRTDLTLGYKFNFLASIDSEISVAVQNLWDNQNVRFFSYSINETSQPDNFLILERSVSHLGRLISVYITFEF